MSFGAICRCDICKFPLHMKASTGPEFRRVMRAWIQNGARIELPTHRHPQGIVLCPGCNMRAMDMMLGDRSERETHATTEAEKATEETTEGVDIPGGEDGDDAPVRGSVGRPEGREETQENSGQAQDSP